MHVAAAVLPVAAALLAVALAAAVVSATPAVDPCANNAFMPLPKVLTCDNTAVLQLDPQFFALQFTAAPQADPTVTAFIGRALDRYTRVLLFGERSTGGVAPPQIRFRNSIFEDKINASVQTVAPTRYTTNAQQYTVTVHVMDQSTPVTAHTLGNVLGNDESYQLELDTNGNGTLSSASVWGLVRGLETLSQAIQWSRYQGVSGWYVYNAPLHVDDAPRFPWRGVLLDTARNYHPLSSILHIVDTMSYVKLNVLHWHLSDAESFPFLSPVHPNLATKAAYSPNATYSANNISTVIAYALDRGIRVVPEIDTPGHTAALGQAYPQLIADCYAWATTSSSALNEGHLAWPAWDSVALDLTQPTVVQPLVASVLNDVSSNFGDPYFHIGGDEVKTSCWNHVPSMVDYMLQHKLYTNTTGSGGGGVVTLAWQNLTDAYELWVQQHVMTPLQRTSIVWEEAFSNSAAGPGTALLPSTIVHVWQSGAMVDQAVKAGFNVINSYGWYVDRQNPTCSSANLTDPTQGCPTMWMWEWTWHTMYAVDPVAFLTNPTTPAQVRQVWGGEIAVFGESVDSANFDARVWTRAPPIAERLWSDAHVTSIYSAQQRFSALRCVWARRGVRMGPSVPAYCQLDDDTGGNGPVPPTPPGPGPQPDDGGGGSRYYKGVATAFIVLFVLSAVANCALFTMYRRVRGAQHSTPALNTEYQRAL